MALIRGHHAFDDHFTQIPNNWVRDERLTLEARGLLAQIMSHRPGWNLSIKSLAARNSIGRDKVKRIMDELLKHGYLERSEKQGHDERGHLSGYDYFTRDPEGVTQEPCKAEPVKAEPVKADKPPKKTIPKEEHKLQKNIDIEIGFAQFWGVYPKRQDKALAKRSFEKALKRASFDEIIAGAESYRDDPNRDQLFTKNPSTWLNADAWENDPLPSMVARKPRKLTNAEEGFLLVQKYRAEEEARQGQPKELDYDMGLRLKGVDDE
jgi:hypothetical protein